MTPYSNFPPAGNYPNNYGFHDLVSNYFPYQPQYSNGCHQVDWNKENICNPPQGNQLLPMDFPSEVSALKNSDNESSSDQKSAGSSPSSVKSNGIWSITEIIGSSMSKILDGVDFDAHAQTLSTESDVSSICL